MRALSSAFPLKYGPSNSLSTGELQRIQLARTLRTETTGVLYVLDEPSIGLHPDNIQYLTCQLSVVIVLDVSVSHDRSDKSNNGKIR